jgi:6-phosphogluconate dehydrogenase
MVERLLRGGHEVVVYNRAKEKVDLLVKKGAIGSFSHKELIENLSGPKVVWIMVPSGKPVEESIEKLTEYLGNGDIIIDGGNSNWRDTQKRAQELEKRGIHYIDCGTSGGIWGLENGYCLMYGGHGPSCEYLEPVFKTLAPENGYIYCGESGGGHFVKMVHNGIEYGMMQAYGEGFEIMKKSPFNIDLHKVSKVWQNGSVVRSWLLELAERALSEDPELEALEPYVQDSGEGRWAVQAAIDFDVPAHVITSSLYTRFQSRDKESFAMKMLAALRNQFGGHEVKKK